MLVFYSDVLKIIQWICENRISKHFVISLKFPRLSLFTVLLAGSQELRYVAHVAELLRQTILCKPQKRFVGAA